ncbi:MAG: invasin domain 3-containing protein, partial [Armatimonadota bacterium]
MSKQISRGAFLALAVAYASVCSAATINIQMQAFPGEAVADGRSSIAITLFVRNSDGSNVPDGTQIVLGTTLGAFRETIVRTASGVARTTLVAGNIPGTARITAATLQNQSNPSTMEVEFVSDRSQLA